MSGSTFRLTILGGKIFVWSFFFHIVCCCLNKSNTHESRIENSEPPAPIRNQLRKTFSIVLMAMVSSPRRMSTNPGATRTSVSSRTASCMASARSAVIPTHAETNATRFVRVKKNLLCWRLILTLEYFVLSVWQYIRRRQTNWTQVQALQFDARIPQLETFVY